MQEEKEKKEITDKQPDYSKAEHLKEFQWKKGQSGNPNGRPRKKTLRELIPEDQEEELVKIYLAKAKEDPRLLSHFIDQVYGKANQTMDVTVKESISDILNEINGDTKESTEEQRLES